MVVYGEHATIMSFIRSMTKLDYAEILHTRIIPHTKPCVKPPQPHTQRFVRNIMANNVSHYPLSNVAHRRIVKSSVHPTFHLVSWISRVKQREGLAYTVHKIRQYAEVSRSLALECRNFSRLPTGTGVNVVVVVNGISLWNTPTMWFPTQYKFSGGRWLLPASYSVDVASHQADIGHTSLAELSISDRQVKFLLLILSFICLGAMKFFL